MKLAVLSPEPSRARQQCTRRHHIGEHGAGGANASNPKAGRGCQGRAATLAGGAASAKRGKTCSYFPPAVRPAAASSCVSRESVSRTPKRASGAHNCCGPPGRLCWGEKGRRPGGGHGCARRGAVGAGDGLRLYRERLRPETNGQGCAAARRGASRERPQPILGSWWGAPRGRHVHDKLGVAPGARRQATRHRWAASPRLGAANGAGPSTVGMRPHRSNDGDSYVAARHSLQSALRQCIYPCTGKPPPQQLRKGACRTTRRRTLGHQAEAKRGETTSWGRAGDQPGPWEGQGAGCFETRGCCGRAYANVRK